MSWTKRQIVEQAFSSVGLASYAFDLTPEELQSALRSLDAMMAVWDAKGARLGYALPGSPGSSDLDTDSGLPDWAVEAVYMNLGTRLAAGMGKTVMPEIKAAAKSAWNTVLSATVDMQPMVLDRMQTPAGAGNRYPGCVNEIYLPEPAATIDAGPDGPLEFMP